MASDVRHMQPGNCCARLCICANVGALGQVSSFAHTEYDRPEFRNLTYILDRIATGRDLYGRGGVEDCQPYTATQHGLPQGTDELSVRLARLQRGRPRGRGSGRLVRPMA